MLTEEYYHIARVQYHLWCIDIDTVAASDCLFAFEVTLTILKMPLSLSFYALQTLHISGKRIACSAATLPLFMLGQLAGGPTTRGLGPFFPSYIELKEFECHDSSFSNQTKMAWGHESAVFGLESYNV